MKRSRGGEDLPAYLLLWNNQGSMQSCVGCSYQLFAEMRGARSSPSDLPSLRWQCRERSLPPSCLYSMLTRHAASSKHLRLFLLLTDSTLRNQLLYAPWSSTLLSRSPRR